VDEIVRLAPDRLRERIAVQRTQPQRLQDHHLERTWKQVVTVV
jgi:hypothetical protein